MYNKNYNTVIIYTQFGLNQCKISPIIIETIVQYTIQCHDHSTYPDMVIKY